MREIKSYDSTFCGTLPIHMINVIQPYGALIIVTREADEIVQVSENVAGILNITPDKIIGRPITDFIPALPGFSAAKEKSPQTITIAGTKYLGFIHSKPTYYVIEINLQSTNEAGDQSFMDVYSELRDVMREIEHATDLKSASVVAARELKKASGIDKVMIYRFDEDWNGNVLAEAQEPDMESYLNFTFPASDIPKQARDLYEKNPYRFIPDINYVPVKLYPVINPMSNAFIDLSDCNVRGVTTVHLEYLENMKVKASMSTRIMKDGKLWGLIACHNKTPMTVSYKMCAIFELLSGIFSARISSLESNEMHRFRSSLSEIYSSLIEETYRTGDLVSGLFGKKNNVLELFKAGGAALVKDGRVTKTGNVPEETEIEDILLWIQSRETESIFVTEHLSNEYEYAAEYSTFASGMVSIPIDAEAGSYLLVFRPEVEQTINWGGDPETRINFEDDMRTYHPRFSFKLWKQQVKGVSAPWLADEIQMAQNLQDFVRDFTTGKSYPKS